MIEITPQYLASQGLSESFPARFWAKVHKTDGCWLWTGHRNKAGYGDLRKGYRGCGQIMAHRGSWIIHFGPIPSGLLVLHNCPQGDNPSCVNPDHLWIGTYQQNSDDASNKGRTLSGERNPSRKLSVDEVREIRSRFSNKYGDFSRLAREFGVSDYCIKCVVTKQTWKFY